MRHKLAMKGILVLLLTVGVTAHAEEGKPDINAAKAAFKAGQEFMQMDRFADAVVEFRKAYQITKDKLVMGQVALAFEKAGDFEAALEAVKVYRTALPKSDRGSVDEMIKRFEKLIKQGRSKKLALPTDKQADTKAPEEQKDPKKVPEGSEEGAAKKGRFWTWIAAGSAGALALGALVVGLNAQSKYDDLESTCAPACANSEVDSVKTRATVTDVLWGMAAGAAVAATVLYFVEGSRGGGESPASSGGEEDDEEEDEDDDDEELDASLRTRLQIVPMIGPGGFGLGATIRY